MQLRERKKNKAKQNKQRKRKQNKKVLEPDCLSDQFFLTERVVARSFKIIAFSSLFQEITFSNSAIWKGDLMIEKFGFSKFSLMNCFYHPHGSLGLPLITILRALIAKWYL